MTSTLVQDLWHKVARPIGSVIPFLSVGAWILLLLLLMDVVVATGLPWALLGDELGEQRGYSLEAQLFEKPPPEKIKLVIIGDRRFTDYLRQSHPALVESAYVLAIPEFSLADLTAIRRAFADHAVERAVVQASPHFWTNYWFRAPALEIGLWQGAGALDGLSFSRAELIFTTFAQFMKALVKEYDEPDRPESLLGTLATDEPRNGKLYLRDAEALLSGKLENLTWLRDDRGTPGDTPAAILEFFNNRFGNAGYKSDFGHVVTDVTDLH